MPWVQIRDLSGLHDEVIQVSFKITSTLKERNICGGALYKKMKEWKEWSMTVYKLLYLEV